MMRLKVRDEIVIVPEYVIDKIPLIQALKETESDQIIELKEISPRFLKHIIQFVNNQQKSKYLKKILDDEYEEQVIKEFLGYLGMDQLITEFYKQAVYHQYRLDDFVDKNNEQ
jgi:hypothetical protein